MVLNINQQTLSTKTAQSDAEIQPSSLSRISQSKISASNQSQDYQSNDMRMNGEKKLDSSLQDTTRVFRHPGIKDTVVSALTDRQNPEVPFHAMIVGVGYQSKMPHSPQTDEVSLAMQGHENTCLTLIDNDAYNLKLARTNAIENEVPTLVRQMDAAKPDQLHKNSIDVLICTNTLIYPFKNMGRVQRAKIIGHWVDRLKPEGKMLIDLPSLALAVSSSKTTALDICKKLSSPHTMMIGTGMIQKLINKQLNELEHSSFPEIKLKAVFDPNMPDPTIVVTRATPSTQA